MIAIIIKSMLIEAIEQILHVICFICEEWLFRVAVIVGCCQTNRTLVLTMMGFTLQGHILDCRERITTTVAAARAFTTTCCCCRISCGKHLWPAHVRNDLWRTHVRKHCLQLLFKTVVPLLQLRLEAFGLLEYMAHYPTTILLYTSSNQVTTHTLLPSGPWLRGLGHPDVIIWT